MKCPDCKADLLVFHTETIESFNLKKRQKYPEELKNEFIFISTDKEFKPEMIR